MKNKIRSLTPLLALAVLLLGMIPLGWLGRYNYPTGDDYYYGVEAHLVWQQTKSIPQAISAACTGVATSYRIWQGTYSALFLMYLAPNAFSMTAYHLVPFAILLLLCGGIFYLLRPLVCRFLTGTMREWITISSVLSFLCVQTVVFQSDSFYWYNGSTHYVLLESVWFFTLTAVSATFWAQSKKKEVVCCIIATLLAILVGGGNLVTGLQAEIVMALLVLYALVTNRKKLVSVCVPFVFGSLGFLFNILAPGNSLREASDADVGFSAVKSIGLSFYHAGVFMIGWTKLLVVLVWLALLPVMWQMVKKSARKFEHPVWVTLGAYCVLSAMFTPTLYALGMVGLSRVDNIIQMVYYLSLFLVTAYWLGYFSHREKRETDAGETLGSFLEKTKGRMTAVFLLLTLVVWVFTADKNTYTGISAARSLGNGEAQTFYAEAMERYALYTDETVVNVEVQPFTRVPALFDFNDLTEDAGNWLNLAVQEYYHKATVRLAAE